MAIIGVQAILTSTVERTELGDSPITVEGAGLLVVAEVGEEEEGTTGFHQTGELEVAVVVVVQVWGEEVGHTRPLVPREVVGQERLVMATGGVHPLLRLMMQ